MASISHRLFMSGDLTESADRSTEAVRMSTRICHPAVRQGPHCCCNRSVMAGSRASAGSTPASTPRTTAGNSSQACRMEASNQSPASVWCLSCCGLSARLVSHPFGNFRIIPRAWKYRQGKPTLCQTTFEQALSSRGHEDTSTETVTAYIPAGRGELEELPKPHRASSSKAVQKICHFYSSSTTCLLPVAPMHPPTKIVKVNYGLHDVDLCLRK